MNCLQMLGASYACVCLNHSSAVLFLIHPAALLPAFLRSNSSTFLHSYILVCCLKSKSSEVVDKIGRFSTCNVFFSQEGGWCQLLAKYMKRSMLCRCELSYVMAKKRINAFTSSVWVVAHRVLTYALVVTHVLMESTLRATSLYIGVSFMFLMAYNGIGCVFEGVIRFVESTVSARRIEVSFVLNLMISNLCAIACHEECVALMCMCTIHLTRKLVGFK